MTPIETLNSLLKEHQAADLGEFQVKHNHAPMVLIALYRLGASSDQLEYYYQNLGVTAKETPSDQFSVNSENWKEHLGKLESAGSCCSFFVKEITEKGILPVLETYLPELTSGMAAHAYHPLLRIGYGLDIQNKTEVAFGLGYWVATHLPVPEPMEGKEKISLEEQLDLILNSESLLQIPMNSNSITNRIQAVYECKEFRKLLHPLWIDNDQPLEEISLLVMKAFEENHDFTILHAVTSCQALRLLLPYCDNVPKVVTEYWHSICAACVTVQEKEIDNPESFDSEEMDWDQIFQLAIETNIEHTIKFIYTSFLESGKYHRDSYKRLAMRELTVPAPFV